MYTDMLQKTNNRHHLSCLRGEVYQRQPKWDKFPALFDFQKLEMYVYI